ncbi:MAG TPA: phosphoribosylanthranilate isomerase [Candidatus Tripitaka californicus]|uniref:phosphoribosylanthranilate isomerase n=1 Tax=Candidatus Tripitaka californicus TaxID=3367616 RepID=UPI00402692A5|nr:phosphoribosylanthranilate isomerase [Planctomycetota bacterium]
MVKVKICGITSMTDARTAVELGTDALGFVFAPSPRQISPNRARDIIKRLPPFVTPVGVFVDEAIGRVLDVATYTGLKAVQLHGSETPGYVRDVMGQFWAIKAIRVRTRRDLTRLGRYEAHAFLLDSYVRERLGGTGKPFPWELAREARQLGTIILAGGLNPENVQTAIRTVRPYAVDVSSGVESSPGKKDRQLVREFIQAVKCGKM